MSYLLLNVLLALVWALLTGVFEPGNLLVGFLFGYLALYLARRSLGHTQYFDKVPEVVSFTLYYLWELVRANLRVAADVLSPVSNLQPRIVGIPLTAHSPAEIVLLSLLIALTPGTLVLDVSTDRRVLYIHALHASDPEAVRREIKDGLERRLLTLMRGRRT
jgi:multicomponent Na+:H+ antiporter subunit E